jgi:phosphoribosylformimino-5-aminoimidazole carboxamide ribotide isomerase
VILGTAIIKDLDFVKKAVYKFSGEKIVMGIDAKDGIVMTDGWCNSSFLSAINLVNRLHGFGVKNIIYTDVKTDGMLNGPNIEELIKMNDATNINIIASGGISNIDDIKSLKKINISGAIIGRAIYEKKIDLREAIKIAK